MTTNGVKHDFDDELAVFFSQTSVPQTECDTLAAQLLNTTNITPVPIQGTCSYTVFAGQEIVVQFRLKSLELSIETSDLARQIFGKWAPCVEFKQQLGEDGVSSEKKPVLVYVMSRVKGISMLEFILEYGYQENSDENKARRKTLVGDFAK